jgi:hypothetical protein
MHSPFALNCESWGCTWGEKLAYELTRSAVVEPETPTRREAAYTLHVHRGSGSYK